MSIFIWRPNKKKYEHWSFCVSAKCLSTNSILASKASWRAKSESVFWDRARDWLSSMGVSGCSLAFSKRTWNRVWKSSRALWSVNLFFFLHFSVSDFQREREKEDEFWNNKNYYTFYSRPLGCHSQEPGCSPHLTSSPCSDRGHCRETHLHGSL